MVLIVLAAFLPGPITQYKVLASSTPINVRTGLVPGPQNEPSIAVNPRNPFNLIASSRDFSLGYRQCRYYYSLDGGYTWGNNLIPMTGTLSPFNWCSDPSVAFDNLGNAYYAALALLGPITASYSSSIFVARSTDGGQTYANPVLIQNITAAKDNLFLDKPYISVDQKRNYVYLTWTDLGFYNSSAWVEFARSLSQGVNFSKPLRITDLVNNATFSTLAQSTVGSNGEVYVEWIRGSNTQSNTTYWLVFDRSLDFGASFGTDRNVLSFPSITTLNPYTFRATSIPSIDADRTNGTHSGAIYITWADVRNLDADIFETHSYDRGINWSQPVRVNDDAIGNHKDQWMPWVNVSPDGNVNIVFYDRRDDSANSLFHLYSAVSRDGGVSFLPNSKVTSVPSSPYVWAQSVNNDNVGQIGDYLGLTSQRVGNATYLYPIWTDTRDGNSIDHNLNVYTAIIGTPTAPSNLTATFNGQAVTLNWSAPGYNGAFPITGYRIYRGNLTGSEGYIASISNLTSFIDHTSTTGVSYYYQVSATNQVGEGPLSNEVSVNTSGPGIVFSLPIMVALSVLVLLSPRFVKRRLSKRSHPQGST